jgi:starch synthase
MSFLASLSNLKPKKKCKRDLIKEFGLSLSVKTPLIGMASYLSSQKGFDILLQTVDKLMEMDVGLVILGKGHEEYENRFLNIQKKYPKKVALEFEMNPGLVQIFFSSLPFTNRVV